MVDPVCGMTVDPDVAISRQFEGDTFYFCSDHCATRFDKDPQGVIATGAAGAKDNEAEDNEHGCCSKQEHAGSGSTKDSPSGGAPGGASGTIYTCPMHPEIEQVGPGSCPKCGMDLEPKSVPADDDADQQQYTDMKRRFWVGVVLSIPLLALAMGPMVGIAWTQWISPRIFAWWQLVLATPVVFWCGWPLLKRGVASFRGLNLNMFTLIAVGSLAAYLFSVVVVLAPSVIPQAFYEDGTPPLYFEASAVIITLVLL